MRRALELAWRGWGRVSPNPLVGAVMLRGDEVVGEGWHAEFGGPHAEVNALRAAGEKARGATMVVTLEPCAHQGKTPPCTDAIRAAGLRRVVAAMRDPDQDAGGGVEILKRAGIETHIGLLAEEAAAQNAPFLTTRLQTERPFVALKLATSIDGRIADARGSSQWISGPEAREHVHWLRAGFDAIGVGGTTALTDNPQLTARGGITPRKPPVRIVFDRRAMLNSGVSIVQTAREVPTWVVASPEAPAANVSVLEGNGVRVFRPETLAQAFAQLRLAGIQSLLCEGGGALGAKLLADGLVDRLYWVQAPVWLGEGAVPAFPGVPAAPLAEAPRWVVVERRPLGSDTLLVLDRRLCLPES
ncbi:MAG TPA: bifunctional diaminohydroxyphosphoribosylaminopyrimidine deaminase/5-amino-6-(5-phosphoribosylamino)uracil reductase RibD [Gemmatimonadales bacterium]|nr:bifunctional diaminohydroxyphosphoribosylaminopyrimidine deaminase/5-amino-6-(5-phosphoribosylamino)uracil reductase RibD [Gemmatimonadales bacterium]